MSRFFMSSTWAATSSVEALLCSFDKKERKHLLIPAMLIWKDDISFAVRHSIQEAFNRLTYFLQGPVGFTRKGDRIGDTRIVQIRSEFSFLYFVSITFFTVFVLSLEYLRVKESLSQWVTELVQ